MAAEQLHDKMKASLSDSAKPADLAAAQATPGTSTSTGGATATRNSGQQQVAQ
jgi:hypothetical protein